MLIKFLEILGSISMIFVVLAIHELGHLLSGLIQGFRFELFVVGPLGIKREDNKVKIYLNKNLEHYGGLAATTPKQDSPENAKILANILLAGPIASLVLAILLGTLYYTTDFPFYKLFLTGALCSIGIFLATTVPNKTGMFFTDRKRYQRLTSDGPEREVELAVLRIIGNYGKDNSYKNVDYRDIETMISDDHYKCFGLFTKLTYQFEMNGEYNQETQNEFDTLSEKMPKSFVKAMRKELEKTALKKAEVN